MLKTETKDADVAVGVPPGISWTAPMKGRPWMKPPKSVSVTSIAQQYIGMLGDEAATDSMLDALVTGMPLAIIAVTLMLGDVSKGVHTLDAGVMVMPVIIEMLKTAAELNDIEYIVFAEDVAEKNTVSPRVLKKVIESATQSIAVSSEEPAMPVEESMGLMARKKKEGEQ